MGMQRVKINAATIGVINGAGQQVIKIHYDGRHHNQPRRLPPVFIKKKRY